MAIEGNASFATLSPLLESVESLDGVCDLDGALDEHRDDGDEFKFSKGISSLLARGLESLDLGVPEWERCFDPSRVFELDGVLIGALDDFEELRRLEDDDGESLSYKGNINVILITETRVTYPSDLLTIWHLLTLPEGILSRLRADATPGILLLVLNNGLCSRGVLAVLDSLNIEV